MAVLNPGHGKTCTGPARAVASRSPAPVLPAGDITCAPAVQTGKGTTDEANPNRQAPQQIGQLAANNAAARRARPRHRSRPSDHPPYRPLQGRQGAVTTRKRPRSRPLTCQGGHHASSSAAAARRRARPRDDRRRGRRAAGPSGAPRPAVTNTGAHDAAIPAAHSRRTPVSLTRHSDRCPAGRLQVRPVR